jgi:hypothetical protein
MNKIRNNSDGPTDGFFKNLLHMGSTLKLFTTILIFLLAGVPNLIMHMVRQPPLMYNSMVDPLNDKMNAIYLNEFWNGYESYNQSLLLAIEAKKYNLTVSEEMVQKYIQKLFKDENDKKDAMERWNIRTLRFKRHVREKILADTMNKLVELSCEKFELRAPVHLKCTAFFLKNPPLIQEDRPIKKSIDGKSCLVVQGYRRTGHVLKFPNDQNKINMINDHFGKLPDLSNEEKMIYIKTLFNPNELKISGVYSVAIDDGTMQSYMLFSADKKAINFNGFGYFACVDNIETYHVKSVVSESDMNLLNERNASQQGSLVELQFLNEMLMKYKDHAEDLRSASEFYQKELIFSDISQTVLLDEYSLMSLKTGDVALLNTRTSDKPFLVIIDEVMYTDDIMNSIKNTLADNGVDMSQNIYSKILLINLMRRFIGGNTG